MATQTQDKTDASALIPYGLGESNGVKRTPRAIGAAGHLDPSVREAAMTKTAALYVQGWPLRKIALALNPPVALGTVVYYLEQIRAAWLASMLRDFDAHRAESVARIDKLEAEAWDAWERSKQPRRSLQVKSKTVGVTTVKDRTYSRKTYIGNPEYLAVIGTCIERRCKLLGLDAPEKHESLFVARNEGRMAAVQKLLSNPAAMAQAHKLIAVARGLPEDQTVEGEFRAIEAPKK